MSDRTPSPATSFGSVADAYDRARPSYPDDAVAWLTGGGRAHVVDLGAGTGKLTEVLHRGGHHVLATEPSLPMLARLGQRVPVPHAAATAEAIPVRSRSVDVVTCGQSFHWFDAERALPEMARVLRPGGVLALAWNTYDTSIPWVRRLKRLLDPASDRDGDLPTQALLESPFFGFVEEKRFRFWQTHTARSLDELARSVSHVATMSERDRERTLAEVASLYDGYGRGHDGMQLPWVTRCFRAVVRHQDLPPEHPSAPEGRDAAPPGLEDDRDATPSDRRPPEDPGMQLIDFR